MSGRACYTALYYIMYILSGDANAFRRFCVRCNLMGKPERFGADLTAAMDRLLLRNTDNLTGVVLRNGVEARWSDIGRDTEAERVNQKITDYCASHNGISLRECMTLLDMTSAEAFRRIDRLVTAQTLKRSGRRYYLSEDVIAPEEYEDTLL